MYFSDTEAFELLSQLVRIPSLSREEGAVADFLQEKLTAMGLKARREGHNLWCWAEGSEHEDGRPVVMLNAHIDTVKPAAGWASDPFTPLLEDLEGGDRKMTALGTNDDGASLVAMLMAFVELSSRPQPYRLVFSATAEEEVSGKGGIEMIMPWIGKVDLGVIGEPTRMQLAVAEKGLMVLDCKSFGVSGHAAREEGVNAIYKALPIIEWFRGYKFPKVSEFTGAVKMSVTQVNAGTQHNVVPCECSFVVDVRNNGMYTNEELLENIKRNVAALEQGADVEIKARSTRLCGSSIDVDHPFVQRGKALGLELFGSPTTSNQSLCRFTTIKVGPGDSARSHTAGEYILQSEIRSGAKLYVKLLDSLNI